MRKQARSALRAAVPDLDKREREKQIEIANGDEWYAKGEALRPHELVNGLDHARTGCARARLRRSSNQRKLCVGIPGSMGGFSGLRKAGSEDRSRPAHDLHVQLLRRSGGRLTS